MRIKGFIISVSNSRIKVTKPLVFFLNISRNTDLSEELGNGPSIFG